MPSTTDKALWLVTDDDLGLLRSPTEIAHKVIHLRTGFHPHEVTRRTNSPLMDMLIGHQATIITTPDRYAGHAHPRIPRRPEAAYFGTSRTMT